MNIKISPGNSKLGSIPSISLPAGTTCRDDCECRAKCYAKRLERIRKSVRDAYQHNYQILKCTPDIYWREVEASIMMSRFFRFHVSGDIPDKNYLMHMIDIAERNSHCEILCFTKKFSIVNDVVAEMVSGEKSLPENLHLIFSGWKNLKMENPFLFPEAHVKFKDGTTTAREDAVECGGNCTECALTEGGCWTLKSGEQVVFDEH